MNNIINVPYSRVVTPPSLLRPPSSARSYCHFLLPYTPPHLHMHTCVWLALTSMFTLVLHCYYVVIFAKCVCLFPCGRLRTCMWYRTMTAILLRRERGRNNAEMYAVLVVTPPPPPPPPSSARSYVSKGGGVTTREYGTCNSDMKYTWVLFAINVTSVPEKHVTSAPTVAWYVS